MIDGIPVSYFNCRENMMEYWWSRLSDLPVPTPDTKIFEIKNEEPPYEDMVNYMLENDLEKAFLRSSNFSDKVNPRTGSKIREPTYSEVKRTFETLYNHHQNHMEVPMGSFVALREWIDLDYCKKPYCDHIHHTELRFLFNNTGDDIEINGVIPSYSELLEKNISADCTYNYISKIFEDNPPENPDEYVNIVAKEFTEYAWHVDFCLSTDMNWYCIDMGLDGVYYDEEKDAFVAMTGQTEERELSIISNIREEVGIDEIKSYYDKNK